MPTQRWIMHLDMRVLRRSFLSSFAVKVYDRDPRRLPALHVGARIPWSGIHERGANIPIAVLVPRVLVAKRLDLEPLVVGRISYLATALEKALAQV